MENIETINEWKKIKNISQKYSGDEYPDKNRYSDILPYNFNKVDIDDYINASWIDIGKKNIIVSQSPLPNTFHDFWKMVMIYDVDKIFMLTDIKENGVIKSHRYWPNTSLPIYIDDIKIENLGCYNDRENITITNLKLEYKNKIKVVKHIHYTGWEDYNLPSSQEDIEYLIEFYYSDKNYIVHCSAGCGRSGTFCGILRYLNTHESSFEILCRLREQRMCMVNTIQQYAFLKNFIKNH